MAKKTPKVDPTSRVHYKLKAAIAAQAIDEYEKKNGLGVYQPKIADGGQIIVPTFPDYGEIDPLVMRISRRLTDLVGLTSKEEVRQDAEQAHYYLTIASRYIDKAFRR